MRKWERERYAAIAAQSCSHAGSTRAEKFAHLLITEVADQHRALPEAGRVQEFEHGPATYLFAERSGGHDDRTLLAIGTPERPENKRDHAYQQGFPLPETIGGRPIDRGHFIPYTAGGLFGPNIFRQDRALNRGWSQEGRSYRSLERLAVSATATQQTTMFVHPTYIDDGDVPAFLAVGVLRDGDLAVQIFRNRFDADAIEPHSDLLAIALAGATNFQIGDLGEETAAVYLRDHEDATIVTMGDSGMPRDAGRQDLDIVAALDRELIAFEVKTQFFGRRAGKLTRAGNLPRPRMRPPANPERGRQGSQPYVTARLGDVVDMGDGYDGIEVRVIAVDLKSRLIQQFSVGDDGRRLSPIGAPADCTDSAREALDAIVRHRGHL
ncbi:MAG: hypothetical protein HZB45_28265 [Mycolicibacterium rufum]|nr:hypothetical protein [Mycolicibacterium rufum]